MYHILYKMYHNVKYMIHYKTYKIFLYFQTLFATIMTMQTFLQEPLFGVTASQLDYRRLGKQRVEAMQIYNILAGNAKSNAWRTHPAVLMWKTYENALAHYYNCIRHEWIKRGYNNTMPQLLIEGDIVFPKWLGYKPFHDSHKSNLLRKFPEYYKQFNWGVPDNLPYIWPV